MRKRSNIIQFFQARPAWLTRLILILLFCLCAGCVLLQGTELVSTHPVQTALIQAEDTPFVLSPPESDTNKTDINQATAADLQRVPGIGPTLAQRIIEAREAQGGFHFLEEVKDVQGIGEKRFEAIREWFYCPLP